MSKLVEAFAQNGFVGADGAYAHFVQFGAAEEVAPNADFNANEYYAAKAAQFYGVEPKAVTEFQIANVKQVITSNGMNAWTHYQQFGSAEGVNPSMHLMPTPILLPRLSPWVETGLPPLL